MDFVDCVNRQRPYLTLVFLGPFWSTGLQTFCTLHRRWRDRSRCCSAPLQTASGTPPCKVTRETVPHASVGKRYSQINADLSQIQIVIQFVFLVLGHHIMRHICDNVTVHVLRNTVKPQNKTALPYKVKQERKISYFLERMWSSCISLKCLQTDNDRNHSRLNCLRFQT